MAFINQRSLHLAAIVILLDMLLMHKLTLAMPVAILARACLEIDLSVPASVSGPSLALPSARHQARQVNPYGGPVDPQLNADRDHASLIVLVVILVGLVIGGFFVVSWRLGLTGVYGAWCRGWRDNLRQLSPKNIWDAWCAYWKDRTRQCRRRREGIELQPYPGPPPSAPYQRLASPARPAPALIRLGPFQVGRRVLGAG